MHHRLNTYLTTDGIWVISSLPVGPYGRRYLRFILLRRSREIDIVGETLHIEGSEDNPARVLKDHIIAGGMPRFFRLDFIDSQS